MDRNLWWGVRKAVGSLVALRKESVDRNNSCRAFLLTTLLSLSARRAWIEMLICVSWTAPNHLSLSARRAWIEMIIAYDNGNAVASLSARRAWIEIACPLGPQAIYPSLSARRAWIEMLH